MTEYTTDHQVKNPSHYSRWKIEPIDFIRANQLDALRANIIKYIMRYDAKEGLNDLMKARRYLDWLIEDAQVDEQVRNDRTGKGQGSLALRGTGLQPDLFTTAELQTRRKLDGSNDSSKRASRSSHPEAVLLNGGQPDYYAHSPSSCEPPDGPGGS
jgi:hypothetical protein